MAHTNRSSEDQKPKIKVILVIEDDADIGAFLAEALKMETPYQALCVADATAALETLKTVVPDLFLLDYHLPGIDGLELAERFHATETLKHIPILLMSANLPKSELEKRHITFIAKPFDVNALFQIIETLLSS